MTQKIVVVAGTRPEAIKLIPIYKEFKKSTQFDAYLLSTGQHKELIEQVFNFFSIYPDATLDVMIRNQNLSMLTSRLIDSISNYFKRIKPDYVVVQGDTTTAFSASLVAFYQQVKILHIEAGLRTGKKFSPFPEEVNRKIISELADLHFAPTEVTRQNLINEGKTNVFKTGNSVIDALQSAIKIVNKNIPEYRKKYKDILKKEKNVLITGHRRENFGEGFRNMTNALHYLAQRHKNYNFIYPVHLNPNVQKPVKDKLSGLENFHLLDPVEYGDLIFLMKNATLILTDSGGIQEEAPSLNVPILVMRDNTERPEGIDAGCALLCGTTQEGIINNFERIMTSPDLYDKMSKSANPYGDGKTSTRILNIVKNL